MRKILDHHGTRSTMVMRSPEGRSTRALATQPGWPPPVGDLVGVDLQQRRPRPHLRRVEDLPQRVTAPRSADDDVARRHRRREIEDERKPDPDDGQRHCRRRLQTPDNAPRRAF